MRDGGKLYLCGMNALSFLLYDPGEDELEPASAPVAMAEDDYEAYGGLAYSEESGRLYYIAGSQLMAAEDFDFESAEAVTELSMGFYDINDGLLLPEDGDEDDSDFVEPEHVLFQAQAGCSLGSFNGVTEPAPLRAKSDLEARVPLEMTVAFVNPYSKNRELAQAFLAEILKNLSLEAAYSLSDEQSAPVCDAKAARDVAEAQARLEELQARLEKAEPADAPAIREDIDALAREIERRERESWRIPAEDIEWYRSHAALLAVDRYNYLGVGEDGELAGLVGQLLAGRMNVQGFLKEIDRKARMRQMEGY